MPCCIILVGGPCTLDMLSIFMPCGPPTAWTPPGPHRGHLDPSNLRLPQVRLCACEALRGRGSDLALAPISTLELAQQLPSVRNCQVRGVRNSADRGGERGRARLGSVVARWSLGIGVRRCRVALQKK